MRPRVRRQVGDDGTEEVTLESYRAAQDAREAQRLLLEALVGRSTRRVGKGSAQPTWGAANQVYRGCGRRWDERSLPS